MIRTFRIFLQTLPWLIILILILWMMVEKKLSAPWIETGQTEIDQQTVLKGIVEMGKIELVQYNFQEVTEIRKIADYVDLRIFKYKLTPDAKGVLISQGSATGCVDLTKLRVGDIRGSGDTLFVNLPPPELCYFKVDLEKSRLYDLQINFMAPQDQKQFVQELYKAAEDQIRKGAMETGILDQTRANARQLMVPMFEKIAGRPVVIRFRMSTEINAR